MRMKETVLDSDNETIVFSTKKPPAVSNYIPMVEQQKQILRELAEKGKASVTENELPEIKMVPGELHLATDAAEDALLKNNSGIYQRGGQLVRIITEASMPKTKRSKGRNSGDIIIRSEDAPVMIQVDSMYLAELLGKNASWLKFDERTKQWMPKDCPEKIAKTLLARSQWKQPVLTGIIQAPTLRPNGSILEAPGYDEQTGLYYSLGQIVFPPVPPLPSHEDALKAKDRLLLVLHGFPFEDEGSKSVAMSGILTSLMRKSLRTAPLHGFTAPKMSSGKSLLADVIGLIACGKANCVMSQADNEAEEKKRLLAVLSAGDSIICYDNIERPLGSAALCSILTQEGFKERLLGTNRNLSVSTNATFLATGNNLIFIGDLSTRAILCRLDPSCERPEERVFDVNLYSYVPEHRGELVIAALTILRAYHVAGRPKQDIPQFGRFEEWSDFIRSALVWIGMADPCESRKEIESNDPVRLSLGGLLSAWFAVFDNTPVKVKAVVGNSSERLKESLLEFAPDSRGGINEISLGKKLQKYCKRIEQGFQLERMPNHQGSATWRVIQVK